MGGDDLDSPHSGKIHGPGRLSGSQLAIGVSMASSGNARVTLPGSARGTHYWLFGPPTAAWRWPLLLLGLVTDGSCTHGDPCELFNRPDVRLVGSNERGSRVIVSEGAQVVLELAWCGDPLIGFWTIRDSTIARLIANGPQLDGRSSRALVTGLTPGSTFVWVTALQARGSFESGPVSIDVEVARP